MVKWLSQTLKDKKKLNVLKLKKYIFLDWLVLHITSKNQFIYQYSSTAQVLWSATTLLYVLRPRCSRPSCWVSCRVESEPGNWPRAKHGMTSVFVWLFFCQFYGRVDVDVSINASVNALPYHASARDLFVWSRYCCCFYCSVVEECCTRVCHL